MMKHCGFYSFITADTKASVSNRYSAEGALPVHVLMPDGRTYHEPNYAGYGDFGDKDFFEMVAEANGISREKRSAGLNIYYAMQELDEEYARKMLELYGLDPATARFPQIVENKDWKVPSWNVCPDPCPECGYNYIHDMSEVDNEPF